MLVREVAMSNSITGVIRFLLNKFNYERGDDLS